MKVNTDWMPDMRWGVMCHYLDEEASNTEPSPTSPAEWNQRIDAFDVPRFVKQIEEIGAGYIIFTLGQNSGYFCSPNATYDELTGIAPSKCSRRDLVAEISDALAPSGIRVIAYISSGAPSADAVAVEKLEWKWGYDTSQPGKHTNERLAAFQTKWEAVISEWSQRWGYKIAGWWVDGCYFGPEMYGHPDAPNWSSFAAAFRSGNAEAVLAFNSGTANPLERLTEEQDYTAGEVAEKFLVSRLFQPLQREMNGMQLHILSFLGDWWGRGEPRFDSSFVQGYTRHINSHGGIVTWDTPIGRDGTIDEKFLEQLRTLKS